MVWQKGPPNDVMPIILSLAAARHLMTCCPVESFFLRLTRLTFSPRWWITLPSNVNMPSYPLSSLPECYFLICFFGKAWSCTEAESKQEAPWTQFGSYTSSLLIPIGRRTHARMNGEIIGSQGRDVLRDGLKNHCSTLAKLSLTVIVWKIF